MVGAETLNVKEGRTTSPRGLEVPEVGRLNGVGCGGLCESVGGGLKAAATEDEPDRLQTGHRDSVDGDLSASSAIDLTMYGTTPAARSMVSQSRTPVVTV